MAWSSLSRMRVDGNRQTEKFVPAAVMEFNAQRRGGPRPPVHLVPRRAPGGRATCRDAGRDARRHPRQVTPEDDQSPPPAPERDTDPALLAMAAELVINFEHGSAGMLNRKLRVPFAEAERLMGELEALNFVGPPPGDAESRDVLVQRDDLDEVLQPLRAAA